MYLTVLSHFNTVKEVNALGDIYNENILLINKKNVDIKTVLIVIKNF
jgi:TRAP-type uncharacterized transport system substrate-binding protein